MKSKKDDETRLIPQETIESKILLVRNKKVVLDRDLALLYRVKTIRLREQVKRIQCSISRRFYVSIN